LRKNWEEIFNGTGCVVERGEGPRESENIFEIGCLVVFILNVEL
jgi:hypothetical protein